MPCPSPRLLLLLPTATYRTTAFVEAARRLGVELTVASERPSTFEQAQPERLLTLDFLNPELAAEQAARFAQQHPIGGVVAVDDDTAIVAAAIAERLRLRGNPLPAALAARDKHLQRMKLAEQGVPVPRFELCMVGEDMADLATHAHYPCVLKPLRLSASRGVIRADDPQGFIAAFQRLKRILEQTGCEMRDSVLTPYPPLPPGEGELRTSPLSETERGSGGEDRILHPAARSILVEEFIPGPEVALEGLVTGGRLQVLTLFDKPDPLDGPFFEETIYTTPSRLPQQAQSAIAGCAQAAVTALDLREGPIHAELRYNERGPWLIELAARPIGGRCSDALRFRGGASLEDVIVGHALGMPPPSLERERQAAGVMMIPVPGAGVLREVQGVAAARALPLIDDVVITAHPGQTLVPWPEGSRYPGFIFARGETPEAVERALRVAHRRLGFVID